jgi:sugar phosphate isomerase/epimerase
MTKLAVYLDELDFDTAAAAVAAAEIGITNVCVRQFWSTNVDIARDDLCQRALKLIKHHRLTVVAVISNHGRVFADKLRWPDPAVLRTLQVAEYLRASFVRFCCPHHTAADKVVAAKQLSGWLDWVGDMAVTSHLQPLLEIEPDAIAFEPDQIASLIAKHRPWQLLYDPAQFVLRRNQDQFGLYFNKLIDNTMAIDVRDHLVGVGPRVVGSGSCGWPQMATVLHRRGFSGWFFLEPAGGGKYQRAGLQVQHVLDALTAFRRFLPLELIDGKVST